MRHVCVDYAADFLKSFLPKIRFDYQTKTNLKNNLHFPFLHCFYSMIPIVDFFLFPLLPLLFS